MSPFEDPTLADTAIEGTVPADAAEGISGGLACDASAQCRSGACTLGVCSEWLHAMLIRIDTTPMGADVTEGVTDFPLLVRLGGAANAFDFSDAQQDGRDIRFVDDRGKNLDYQIERWLHDDWQAELWVSVPRIEGNSRANTVVMYWGNELAPAISSGAAVFGKYDCVYHMNGSVTERTVQDDSGHQVGGAITQAAETNHGTVIAYGLELERDGNISTSKPLDWPAAVSTSLWFKVPQGWHGALAGFFWPANGSSSNHLVLMNSDGTLSFSVVHQSAPAVIATMAAFDDNAWHLLTARLSSAGQYLFVDGESVAENPTLTSADLGPKSYWGFGIPSPGPTAQDAGTNPTVYLPRQLDEIRVRHQAESAAWIKLAYATQRLGSTAVRYESSP